MPALAREPPLSREKLQPTAKVLFGDVRRGLEDADDGLVAEEGEIAERGTHKELLEKNGIYAKMWAEYQQSVTWTLDNAKNEGVENV